MNRRLLLVSLAIAPIGRVAAQTNPQPQTTPAPAHTISPPAPAPSSMTDAQRKHIHDTTTVGSLSLMLSRIALPKANHPLLKQFVEFEIAEQETVADILKAIDTNAAPTGSVESPSDAALMQNIDDAGKASVENLRSLHSGPQFDHDYIQYEVEGHRKLLDIQEVYLKAHDNLDQTNVAKLARGMIKEHLALLADMAKVG
jgi:putative membrane protein